MGMPVSREGVNRGSEKGEKEGMYHPEFYIRVDTNEIFFPAIHPTKHPWFNAVWFDLSSRTPEEGTMSHSCNEPLDD